MGQKGLMVVVDVLTLAPIIKTVVTGHAPVTLEWRNTQRKKFKTNRKRYCTRIYHS